MTGLSPALEAVESYLAHVVDGRTLGDLSRADGCHTSTHMRRVNRIEKLIDHPEWAAVLDALRAPHQKGGADMGQDRLCTRATVALALGLTVQEVHRQFAPAAKMLTSRRASLIAGDMPLAAVMIDGTPEATAPRIVALAALAFGWLVPVGKVGAKVRRFEAAPEIVEVWDGAAKTDPTTPPPRHYGNRFAVQATPIEALTRRKGQTLVTPAHEQLAREFHEIWEMRENAMQMAFAQINQAVPQSVMAVLIEICGKHTGFEETEKKLGLPARSAKAIIPMALDIYACARRAA